MDRVLREERAYILNLIKQIKKAGCNVLLIQKSILRDAVNDLALHFLAKMKIMVIKEVEREDVEFVCKVRVFSSSVMVAEFRNRDIVLCISLSRVLDVVQ